MREKNMALWAFIYKAYSALKKVGDKTALGIMNLRSAY